MTDMTRAEAEMATAAIKGNLDAIVDIFFTLPLGDQRDFLMDLLVDRGVRAIRP